MRSLLPGTEERIAKLSHSEIAYSESKAEGPTLVLVHGLSVRRDSFRNVVPFLLKRFHVFAIDLRGHGFSSRHEGGYTFTEYSADLAEFVDQVVGNPAFVWGQSLGASTAIIAADRFPGSFSAVFAEDPGIMRTESSIPDDSYLHEALLNIRDMVLNNLSLEETIAVLTDGKSPDEIDSEANQILAEGWASLNARAIEAALERQLFVEFHPMDSILTVQCPAFLAQADPDLGGIILDSHIRDIEPLPPNWQFKRYSGAEHVIHYSNPEEIARDAIEFFDGIG